MSLGSKWVSLARRFPVCGRKGILRWASTSIGRWTLILELGSFLHSNGLVSYAWWALRFFHFGGLDISLTLLGRGAGKLIGSLAAAGFRGVGVQAIAMATVLCLCLRSAGRGGIAISAARIVTGVKEKQLVAHLRALCHKTSSL